MKSLLLPLLLAFVGHSAFAASIELFDQKLDPKSTTNLTTFKQRFMVDTSFAAAPSSPVLYYICGESSCFDGSDPIPELLKIEAKEFQANIVVLEHRYFGKSQPFDQLTRQNMRFLSFENALLDLATFEKYLIQTRGFSGKWISIGGSYPGTLSAFYRLKYPDLVVGALASSAPVRTKLVMTEFADYANAKLGPACVADVQRTYQNVRDTAKDPAALAAMEKSAGLTISLNAEEFIAFLDGFPGSVVQYGAAPKFCAAITKVDSLPNFIVFVKNILNAFGITADSAALGPIETDVHLYDTGVGMRQWTYLECTELGFFDTRVSAASCTDLFGTIPFDKLWHVNQTYYKKLLDPATSNILFTNGSEDPWLNYSIAKELRNDTNPNTKVFTIQGGSHTADIVNHPNASNSVSLKEATELITKTFRDWLK